MAPLRHKQAVGVTERPLEKSLAGVPDPEGLESERDSEEEKVLESEQGFV